MEVYESVYEEYYDLAQETLNLGAGAGRADFTILNLLGVQASAIGNHEYDAGAREVQNIIDRTYSLTTQNSGSTVNEGWIGNQFGFESPLGSANHFNDWPGDLRLGSTSIERKIRGQRDRTLAAR